MGAPGMLYFLSPGLNPDAHSSETYWLLISPVLSVMWDGLRRHPTCQALLIDWLHNSLSLLFCASRRLLLLEGIFWAEKVRVSPPPPAASEDRCSNAARELPVSILFARDWEINAPVTQFWIQSHNWKSAGSLQLFLLLWKERLLMEEKASILRRFLFYTFFSCPLGS